MEDYEATEVANSSDVAAATAAAMAAGSWASGSKNAEYQFDVHESVLGRRCIWSHHICCPFKRRYIQQCARCDHFHVESQSSFGQVL
jgi:hypothetical protein